MGLADYEDPTDRTIRLESKDNKVFARAFLGLLFSTEYALETFSDTTIEPCLKKNLADYTPKFKNLTSDFLKENLPKYITFIQNAREREETKEEAKKRKKEGGKKEEVISPIVKKYLLGKFQAIPQDRPKQYLQARIEQSLK